LILRNSEPEIVLIAERSDDYVGRTFCKLGLIYQRFREVRIVPTVLGQTLLQRALAGIRAADVRLLVGSNETTITELDGIVIRESRPGWIALDLPPIEAWRDSLLLLPREQQDRITSPEFYQFLQRYLLDRFSR
jgi:hypothetical protein